MMFKGKYILAAIDGTGSHEWRRADGSNSHIAKFKRDMNVQGGVKEYWDGPGEQLGGTVFGTGSGEKIDQVVSFIKNSLKILNTRDVRVCIVGHSRGGLIAINAAKKCPVKVYFLGLYDAVDMHPGIDADVITNVEYAYHAIRHPAIGSRYTWGNTGTKYTHDVNYTPKEFKTSHGGIGGDVVSHPKGLTADYSCEVKHTEIYFNQLWSAGSISPKSPAQLLQVDGYTDIWDANKITIVNKKKNKMCLDQSVAANRWMRRMAASCGIRL